MKKLYENKPKPVGVDDEAYPAKFEDGTCLPDVLRLACRGCRALVGLRRDIAYVVSAVGVERNPDQQATHAGSTRLRYSDDNDLGLRVTVVVERPYGVDSHRQLINAINKQLYACPGDLSPDEYRAALDTYNEGVYQGVRQLPSEDGRIGLSYNNAAASGSNTLVAAYGSSCPGGIQRID